MIAVNVNVYKLMNKRLFKYICDLCVIYSCTCNFNAYTYFQICFKHDSVSPRNSINETSKCGSVTNTHNVTEYTNS